MTDLPHPVPESSAESAETWYARMPGPSDAQHKPSTTQPQCFLILHNVSKRHNIGNLLRSATAFGVHEVCLVGSRHFNTFGSHGACDYVQLKHFQTLQECCTYLKGACGCQIVGVEITDAAQPIQSHPFEGPTAFMLGNEGSGLSEKQIQACDGFVYIPQHGPGTASLNVYVAASIVLHHFALWAGYQERSRTGFKFDVAERPARTSARGTVPLSPEEMAKERERRGQALESDSLILGFNELLLEDGDHDNADFLADYEDERHSQQDRIS